MMDTELTNLRALLKSKLQEKIMKIRFEKADGSVREMLCTLLPECLPEWAKPQSDSLKESQAMKNMDVLPVFDLEKDAWRSFRIDSVISYYETDTKEVVVKTGTDN